MSSFHFPDQGMAWLYFGSLMGFLSIASIIDLKTFRIPKVLCVFLLVTGLLASLVRGATLGHQGQPVWLTTAPGTLVGGLDALLLSLCTGLIGFLGFLVLWKLGICGGGDVKLFTATAVWLAPDLALLSLAASLSLVCIWVFCSLVVQIGLRRLSMSHNSKPYQLRLRGTRVSYSLPLTISVGTVLLVAWSKQLFG